MKFINLLFITSLSLQMISCSKNEFKETKLPSMPSANNQVETAPPQTGLPAVNPSQALPPGHPPVDGQKNATPGTEADATKVAKIKKVKGGVTVQECFKGKAKLNGKEVLLKAQVVKYNSGILNKNWLHLQDGTGSAGENDLVVTTLDQAKVGDIVTVKGKVSYGKDIGSGYFFPAIIEDAKIVSEK